MVAVVADRVIVDLEARLDQYDANVRRAEQNFTRATSRIQADARRAEDQVRRSFGGIRQALLASASLFAGAAGAGAVIGMADAYTRFTNQLKVAGIEGANLTRVQNDLFGVAQRYGVELESVGTLYSRLSQGSKELGASQADLLKFTTGVGAALKVQGGSAAQSSGALLQLTQALGSEFVRAEEFNSINEGARPILQAVANASDKYAGSVAKLRAAVIGGTLTSREFFQLFLKGSADLEKQATAANFTIGASFTVLNNALGKYVGETDTALSATARISQGVTALAENLDTIVPALAGVAVGFIGVRAGAAAFDLVTAAAARALATDQATAAAILKGNASYVSRAELAAASAIAAREAAAAEVASLEATLAARKADQAAIAQTLALLEAQQVESAKAAQQQRANAALNFGLGRAVTSPTADRAGQDARSVITTRRALAAVNTQVAATETALAGAQGRVTAATAAETAAVTANTFAKRAGAVANALFAGTLSTIVGLLPFLAIAAVTAAIISYATSTKAATTTSAQFAEQGRELANNLALVDQYSRGAAGGIASVGNQAASGTAKMLSFAGATGEAAQKLYELATAQRRQQLVALLQDKQNARRAEIEAQDAYEYSYDRNRFVRRGTRVQERTDATTRGNEARRRQREADQGIAKLLATPRENFLTGSQREGGRDVEGELARVTRDLTVARERGIKSQVDALEAQKFELGQYKKYRAQGLSPQAAQEASNRDRSDFQAASRGAAGDRAAKAGAAADKREARQAAAEERDALADTARYASQERRVQSDIATARADLAGSAEDRVAIERARVEDERLNRAEEIRQSVKMGQLGEGAVAERRALELARLNDERAGLQLQLIDQSERRRIADEALDMRKAELTNAADIARAEQPLADTADDRARVARRLLDLQYEQERVELRAITVANGRTVTEERIAQARLAALDRLETLDRGTLARQEEGPGARFRREFESLDINDQLEQVQINGVQQLEDGLVGLVDGTKSVSDAFTDMATSIIRDLVRIAAQKFILQQLVGALFPGSTTASVSAGAVDKGGLIDIGFTRRASGGHVIGGQTYPVNEYGNSGRVEGFMPAGSGKIIPLGQMSPAGAGSGSQRGGDIYMPISVSAPGANAQTVELIRTTIGDAAPSLLQATKRAVMRDLGRKRMT
jgi:tape measure domain-containing protein